MVLEAATELEKAVASEVQRSKKWQEMRPKGKVFTASRELET